MYHQIIILVKEKLEKIELVGGGQNHLMGIMTRSSLAKVVIEVGSMLVNAVVGIAQLYLTLQSNQSPRTD